MIIDSSNTPNENSLPSLLDINDQSLMIPFGGDGDEIENEEQSKIRFYSFKLGEIGLLLENEVNSEVIDDVAITFIPLMPAHIVGLCNVRGNLVPVYDLHKKFEFQITKANKPKNRVLVLDENEDMAGILIQEMPVLLKFKEDEFEENVPTVHEQLNNHFKFCYKKDGDYWFGFDHISLFESL